MERILYEKCIDFNKKAMLENHKKMFEYDKRVYLEWNIQNLTVYLQELNEKYAIVKEKIKNLYFVTDKRKQKLCIIHPIAQEELRSEYYFLEFSIDYLKKLIEEMED